MDKQNIKINSDKTLFNYEQFAELFTHDNLKDFAAILKSRTEQQKEKTFCLTNQDLFEKLVDFSNQHGESLVSILVRNSSYKIFLFLASLEPTKLIMELATRHKFNGLDDQNNKYTLIELALKNKDKGMLECILITNPRYKLKSDILYKALISDLELTQFLIEKTQPDNDEFIKCLGEAIINNQEHIIDFLLDKGTNPNDNWLFQNEPYELHHCYMYFAGFNKNILIKLINHGFDVLKNLENNLDNYETKDNIINIQGQDFYNLLLKNSYCKDFDNLLEKKDNNKKKIKV